jgi:O-antigen/teichoic acid export membrane protein
LLIFQIDRILLSRYLGLEAVAFYEIGSSFAQYARTFALALFSPMLPAVSELHAREEQALLAGLYRRAIKFMAMIAIPFGLMVVGLAHPFMRAWMGEGFDLAATTLQLLLPVYLLYSLTGPGTYILSGSNRPEIAMRGAVLAGVANLCLCFYLVRSVGYFGLIAGIAIALTVAAGYLLLMIHRHLPELDPAMYRGIFLRPLLFSVPAAGLLHYGFAVSGVFGLVPVVVAAGLFLGGALLVLLQGDYLDDFERQVLAGVLPRGRK